MCFSSVKHDGNLDVFNPVLNFEALDSTVIHMKNLEPNV